MIIILLKIKSNKKDYDNIISYKILLSEIDKQNIIKQTYFKI